jgi:lipopolysaccharide export system permease protein
LLLSSIITFGNLGETFEIVAIKAAGIPLLRFMRPLSIASVFISGIAFLFANNIIPYEKSYNLQDNLLVAASGIMRTTADRKFLEFVLYNGWRYQEQGPHQTIATDYIKTGFKQYKKVFDLKSFQLNKSNDSALYNPKILSIRQLQKTVDSLKSIDTYYVKRSALEIDPYLAFVKYRDSVWSKPINTTYSYPASITDSIRSTLFERVANQLSQVKSNAGMLSNDYLIKQQSLRNHEIEWHRKFTLSVACLVLFLIGAPLGSIIRKGGLGSPLVFAIVFFVLFHLLNTFGEKFAKEGVTSVFFGMWLSTLILIPIGAFLIYKAMRDSQLFNKEFYFRFFRSVKSVIDNFRNRN